MRTFLAQACGPVQLNRLQVDCPQRASKRRLEMILDDTFPAHARLFPESVFDPLPPDVISEFGERDSCLLLFHQSQEFLSRGLVERLVPYFLGNTLGRGYPRGASRPKRRCNRPTSAHRV